MYYHNTRELWILLERQIHIRGADRLIVGLDDLVVFPNLYDSMTPFWLTAYSKWGLCNKKVWNAVNVITVKLLVLHMISYAREN